MAAGLFRSVALGSLGGLVGIALSMAPISSNAQATSAMPGFAPQTVVDHQRIDGEPSIAIDSHNRVYVSAPNGFLTTASWVWRSDDGGNSFHLVPGQELIGKPNTCVGGGDSALAIDSADNVYFADLQGLTEVSNSVSSDQGAHWNTTCRAANNPAVDRPWIAAYRNPFNGGAFYQTVDDVGQCVGQCNRDLGQVGNNVVEITESNDGVTFAPNPGQQIEPDGIVSGIVTDQNTGDVYIAHTGMVLANGHLGGSDANGNSNAIVIDRFPGGFHPGTTPIAVTNGESLCQQTNAPCATNIAFQGPLFADGNSTVNVGQDFAPLAIDKAGNLYEVWSQAPVADSTGQITGSSQIYLAVSTDHAAHWTVSPVTAATPTLQTNIFPWVTAGDSGRVDIVWYGTPTLGSCPDQPCGSSSIQGRWFVEMAQSLDAVQANGRPNPALSFATTQVSPISNHYGAICTMGIGCSLLGGGDRGLLDFLSVTTDSNGNANVVWSDAGNNNNGSTSTALIAFSHQTSGPSLFAGKAPSSATATGPCTVGSPDAFYSANTVETPASNNLVIENACIALLDSQHYQVTMTVKDLSSLAVPPTLGGTDAVWLVRWQIPVANPNQTTQGHIFYAFMESDAGGTPNFYDGESTLGAAGFMTYPSTNPIVGSYTAGSPGMITMSVPIADVGNNAGAALYAVTGLTATQLLPSTASPLFNQVDATAPLNLTPSAVASATPTPTVSPTSAVAQLAPTGAGRSNPSWPLVMVGLVLLGSGLGLAGWRIRRSAI